MKILIVEDDPQIGSLLRRILQREGYHADHCTTVEAARALARSGAYEAMLLDLSLGASNGIDLLAELQRDGLSFPVLVLTGEQSETMIARALDTGADDYMVKPARPLELAARIRALLRRRNAPSTSGALAIGTLVLDRLSRTATIGGEPLQLSPREFVLLDHLMRHATRVVTRTTLLETLWPDDFDPGSNVVDVHVARLRRKLEAGGAPVRISTVRGVGFSLVPMLDTDRAE